MNLPDVAEFCSIWRRFHKNYENETNVQYLLFRGEDTRSLNQPKRKQFRKPSVHQLFTELWIRAVQKSFILLSLFCTILFISIHFHYFIFDSVLFSQRRISVSVNIVDVQTCWIEVRNFSLSNSSIWPWTSFSKFGCYFIRFFTLAYETRKAQVASSADSGRDQSPQRAPVAHTAAENRGQES